MFTNFDIYRLIIIKTNPQFQRVIYFQNRIMNLFERQFEIKRKVPEQSVPNLQNDPFPLENPIGSLRENHFQQIQTRR